MEHKALGLPVILVKCQNQYFYIILGSTGQSQFNYRLMVRVFTFKLSELKYARSRIGVAALEDFQFYA